MTIISYHISMTNQFCLRILHKNKRDRYYYLSPKIIEIIDLFHGKFLYRKKPNHNHHNIQFQKSHI